MGLFIIVCICVCGLTKYVIHMILLKLDIYIKAPPGNCGAHVRMTALLWTIAAANTAGQLQLY